MAHTIDSTPNTGLPFRVLTSYNDDIFASAGNLHGGGDAGFGSLLRRDVATELVMYKPYDNTLDTMIQLTGKFETANNSVHEWIENDELLPDEGVGVDAGTAGRINGGAYTPATTGLYVVSEDDANIFRLGDVVRYPASTGYVYALITNIAAAGSSRVEMTLTSFTGNLAQATSATAKIERMHSLRGSDLNFDVQPRASIPQMYYTYINNIVHDARYGRRVQNEDHYLSLLDEQERKLFAEMRRSREIQSLYGTQGLITLSNGDKVYSSPGLYNKIAGFNKDTAEFTTGGVFDSNKFKAAINDWIEFNFGGESGGPDTRTAFVSGKFASYLSQAFEDKQRFYGQEFIGGVRAMRFEHNLGVVDFVYTPVMDYKHPIPGGSLREGTGKAVAMLCPVDTCVTRLVMKGEGPRSEVFKERGGDVEENMRVQTTEGLKVSLLQYCGVLEEQ
jgi:hypothetical protein